MGRANNVIDFSIPKNALTFCGDFIGHPTPVGCDPVLNRCVTEAGKPYRETVPYLIGRFNVTRQVSQKQQELLSGRRADTGKIFRNAGRFIP